MGLLIQKFKLLLVVLALLLCGCQKKELSIRAYIPKDVAISKNIAINNNKDEVGTKGVEMILAPIATGVTKGFLSSRTDIRKNCIEYNIVIYEGSDLKFFSVDFLNGRIIFERNGR